MPGFFKKFARCDNVASSDAALPDDVPANASVAAPEVPPVKRSWAERLKAGLARTRQQLGGGLANLFGRRKIDEDLLEELEATLLMADCGVEVTHHLIEALRAHWKKERLETADQLRETLASALLEVIAPLEEGLDAS
ncbi:MAG: signal recognition particle receptor subunit alpha, partial [Azoarcus sp.]|nr:signal recognition particle receptor subunit alpha [Azoarcus sp.]